MIPFKKIGKISTWKKLVALGLIATLSVFTILYVSILIDRELYKNLILETIKKSIDYQINAEHSALVLFPRPELRISEITIHKNKDEQLPFARIGEMQVVFSWMSLIFRKIQISEIEIRNGSIQIFQNEKVQPNSAPTQNSLLRSNSFLKLVSIKNLSMENINLEYNTVNSSEIKKLYIHKSQLKILDYFQSFKLDFFGKLDNNKLEIHGNFSFKNKTWDYASLMGNMQIDAEDFDLSYFNKYLKIFYNGNFTNSKISINSYLEKSTPDTLHVKIKNATLSDFGLAGQNYLPQIRITSDFDYNHKTLSFVFYSIFADQPGIFKGRGNGVLKLHADENLSINATSDFLNFDGLMKLIKLFNFNASGLKKNQNFIANYKLSLSNLKIWGFSINKGKIELRSINKIYFVNRLEAEFFNGEIIGHGKMSFDHIPVYDFEIAYSSVDTEKFLAHYTKDKYITGQFEGIVKVSLVGKTTQELFRTLRANGSFTIYKGELLGYANIVKPIASVGKLINILGPKGKSTEFQFLQSDYSISEEEIDLKKIKMKGVGIDIDGQGTIGFNKEINMRFTAGLSGIAGKAIKVPVFYKGVMPKNWGYVDPIWLATVAGGAILSVPGSMFGGPIGGGIAGSAVYEYVRGFLDGVTGIFTKKKEEKKE
ncbi:MAG: hypothetical protein L6Q54_14940 [Leptospiraceae bacterium]|nr:hypothetical protein [Leptospiraceae bacterium]MCK6382529.1 hypothetical protein [Leptospiraceae bacterium]NUM42074.1 hypothetical protein [Leptospiraceae bacterium]